MTWNRTCVTCQQPFVATHACQKFCGQLCRYPPKNCEACGISFSTPNIRTQRYCSTRCSISVRDMVAVRMKRLSNFGGAPSSATCGACNEIYQPTSSHQKNCARCSPTKGARARLRRYGVSHEQWSALVARHDGACWICRRRPAVCQDHDHGTNRSRGALCRACNMALGFIEDTGWVSAAQEYLAETSS